MHPPLAKCSGRRGSPKNESRAKPAEMVPLAQDLRWRYPSAAWTEHRVRRPTEAVEDGCDAQGDPKYRVRGDALDGRRIEVVCVLKRLVVLITVYVLRDLP